MEMPSHTRRSVLRSGAIATATGLAGCTSLFGTAATTLVVHNENDDRVEVTITVVDSEANERYLDGEPVSVAGGASSTVSEDLPRTRGQQITVDPAGDAEPQKFVVRKAAAMIHVYLRGDDIEFVVEPADS